MGIKIGMPSIKLNSNGNKSGHCGDFRSVAKEALEERIGKDTDIDLSLSHKNVIDGMQTAVEMIKYSERHIKEMNKANASVGKRKIRADAVIMIATIIKPPAYYMNTLTPERQQKFLTDAVYALAQVVGTDNIKSVAYHYDELGAHAHIFWEPMTLDGRLCAKEVHNLKFFSRINKEIPEHMRTCGWDIEDCCMYDKSEEQQKKVELGDVEYREQRHIARSKRGRSSRRFKNDAEAEKEHIDKELYKAKKELHATAEKINTAHSELEKITKEISIAKTDIDYLNSNLAPLRIEYEAKKAIAEPESEYYIEQDSKMKKKLFSNYVEMPVKLFNELRDAATLYKRAQKMMAIFEEGLKKLKNNTVEYLNKVLAKVTAERDRALAERANAIRERDMALEEKRDAEEVCEEYKRAYDNVISNVPAAAKYINEEQHRENSYNMRDEIDYDDR